MYSKKTCTFVAAVVALCAPLFSLGSVNAATLTLPMTMEFSGAFPPEGAIPWITATFDDGGGAGSVDLKMEATNLVDTEFVAKWFFNLDPLLDPTSLIFTLDTIVGAMDVPVDSVGVDAFKADGDGKYDFKFDFANGGGAASRFGVAESISYTITGIPTLTASSFDFLSLPAGGKGPFTSAAHVQGIGIGGGESGWVTVPEPSSVVLAAMGLVGMLVFWRRRVAR